MMNPDLATPSRDFDPAADLALAIQRAGAAKSSFYTAMRLLETPRRNAMYAIYAFCRDVDDIADEPAPEGQKTRELDLWRRAIADLYEDRIPTKPLARALRTPIQDYDLRESDFLAVIDGMQMDADRDIRAPDLAELDLYCDRVAAAVGRLSVRVFGPWRPAADEVADHLGRALQLTNILRDVDEDAERGRLYLPRETLAAHGITSDDPAMVLASPALSPVCRDLAELAQQHYAKAEAAMIRCERTAMRPAMMMSGVYHAILDRLILRGWGAPRPPVKLGKIEKLWIAFRRGYL